MIKRKMFNIQPDTSLFSKMGKTGYTIPKSLGELIDNAYDNKFGEIVNVDIYFQINGDEIIIKDDAFGMDEFSLEKALKIGYHKSNAKNTIGEYGFGLKSAASYLGKDFTIYSKTKESSEVIKFIYKEEKFKKDPNNWSVEFEFITIEDSEKEIGSKIDHGTVIKISNLNISLYPALADSDNVNGRLIPALRKIYMIAIKNNNLTIRLHIRDANNNMLLYNEKGYKIKENKNPKHYVLFDEYKNRVRYDTDGKLIIYKKKDNENNDEVILLDNKKKEVLYDKSGNPYKNQDKIQRNIIIKPYCTILPYDYPELIFKCNFSFDIEMNDEFEIKNKKHVEGWIGVIEPPKEKNSKKNSGIYLHNGFFLTKNNRIVTEKEHVGYSFHPETRLICGLINLNDFETRNTKDSFVKDESWKKLNDIMEETLIKAIRKICGSKNVNKIRAKLENSDVNFITPNELFDETINKIINQINEYYKQVSETEDDIDENYLEDKISIVKKYMKNFHYALDGYIWNRYLERMKTEYNNKKLEHIDYKESNNFSENKKIYKNDQENKNELKTNAYKNNSVLNRELVFKCERKFNFEKELEYSNLKIYHYIDQSQYDFPYEWKIEDDILKIITNEKNIDGKSEEIVKNIVLHNIENSLFEYFVINSNFKLNKEIILNFRKIIYQDIKKIF